MARTNTLAGEREWSALKMTQDYSRSLYAIFVPASQATCKKIGHFAINFLQSDDSKTFGDLRDSN
jgi:hypothetical protein